MKRLTFLFGIILIVSVGVSSCKKNDPNAGDDPVKGMEDLIVSSDFDWKTTKTVDVSITLPAEDFAQVVSIYSISGDELYYAGYAINSGILITKITIPTSVTEVMLVYGLEENAEPKLVDVGDNLVYDFNSSKSLTNGKSVDDCGCEGGLISLTMRYNGTSAETIKVKENKNSHTLFCGEVDPDADFTITGGSKKNGRFHNTIDFYVDGQLNATMHVSCSVPLEAGDDYGDFTIVSGISRNNNLPLCGSPPPDPPPPPPPSDPPATTNNNIDGSLAYEDLWPGKGDYDFNDLIIDYKFTVAKDDDDNVQSVTGVFTVYAFGASFHNGFGFTFPNVDPDQIISVSGYEVQSGGIFTLASNGLEDNQSKATIIVYDDSYNILTHPGNGIGVNTEQSAPYVAIDSVIVNMIFFDNGAFATGGPVSYADLDIGNFNPFIIVNQDRDVEVHLLDFPPTDLADQSIFGTFSDDSDANQQRYYTTSNNLPWAINLPVVFEYPQEKKEITTAYLKFAAWAESEGALFTDWYEDVSGYRDDTKIYTPPSK